MKNLILIKLGGSLITNKKKAFTTRLSVIRRLSKEIYDISKKKSCTFIVGHGGGSFPHHPAKKYQTHKGLLNKNSIKGIAEVQDAASKLNRIVVGEFMKAGVSAISFSPSSFLITEGGKIKKVYIDSLLYSLKLEMLPVVYGDVTFDTKKGCNILSTEQTLNYLALKLKSDYKTTEIVYCGVTDGVYDENGRTINKITKGEFNRLKKNIGESEGIDVTGGMLHKVKEALKVAKKGIPTLIINGKRKGELTRAVIGKSLKGTTVVS